MRPPPLISIRLAACGLALLGLTACGTAGRPRARLQVVAAEDFWGSIASQLAGNRGTVQSIIVNPTTDPHSYEPTPADARTLASSTVAIVNGIGYDTWASRLLAADSGGPAVVTVGDILGLSAGDNPHQWYSPSSVRRVVAAIVAAFDKVDPANARYFATRMHLFEATDLARYDALLAEIRHRYAGVPVGYSESIFAPLGQSLGLRLLTPASFADAIAEGADVSAQDTETVERQARDRLIKVWIFNSQNVTPEVDQVNAIARAAHIPIVTITETLSPTSLDFEQWQVAQLERLLNALRRATRGSR
jgi:zinc/manganese transport system substrate-binding protein